MRGGLPDVCCPGPGDAVLPALRASCCPALPPSVSGSYGDVAGPFQFGAALLKSSVKTACRCGFPTPWATSL